MATLEVEVISKEIIKPSSPTPTHLRYYHFSSLDQTSLPQIYSSMVLFFESNSQTQLNITEIYSNLKTSLSETLKLYYPLAGRSHDNLYIDCNDNGVPFLVAQVNNCMLSDVLRDPIPDELTKLVAFELDDIENDVPLGVQLNVFGCRGFAIGLCISHKIADGLSMVMFARAWTAIARRALGDREAKVQCPEFISAALFPTKLFPKPIIGIAKNKLVTKRFVFDASNIEYLRTRYEGASSMKRPSRIETLSAFIWSRFANISKEEGGIHEKLHHVTHVVNLRPKFDPPLPPHTFGNLISFACSSPSLSNTNEECHGLARLAREAITKINKGYIKKLQGGADHENKAMIGNNEEGDNNNKQVYSFFTGLCKFPLYDNDFGWGKPSWVYVRLPGFNVNNQVIFIETKDSDGIEAYISSSEEAIVKLQRDDEFNQRVNSIWNSRQPSSTYQRGHFCNSMTEDDVRV